MADDARGVADGEDLGVRRGVAGELALVVPCGDDDAVTDDDRTDGYVVVGQRSTGFGEAEAM